jgi:ribonuclease HIII
MSGKASITLQRGPIEAPSVRTILELNGFDFSEAPYAFWRAKGPHCTITFYEKGKVVLQGKAMKDWAEQIEPGYGDAMENPFAEAMDLHPKPVPERWVGIDETGKGDYFGPLVTVAAAIQRDSVPLLVELGVGDSKKFTDTKIIKMARELQHCCVYKSVIIGPAKYNALYAKIGNLNRLLGWAHACALESVLEAAPDCTYGLSDRFAKNDRVIGGQLQERGRAIRFDQRVRGESDPAVAVASILARAQFVRQMERLEKTIGVNLPKGASPAVITAGRRILDKGGMELLSRAAKLHFKTTKKLGSEDEEP